MKSQKYLYRWLLSDLSDEFGDDWRFSFNLEMAVDPIPVTRCPGIHPDVPKETTASKTLGKTAPPSLISADVDLVLMVEC